MFKVLAVLLIMIVLFSACSPAKDVEHILTEEERSWLQENREQLIFAMEESYPPFIFKSSKGTHQGISIDYLKEFEKMLNITFPRSSPDDFYKLLEGLQRGELAFISSAKKTEARSHYLLFTESYIELQTVILTNNEKKNSLTLEQLDGLKIGVGKNYSIHEYLTAKYPTYNIIPANNDLEGMEMLAFDEVDVIIGDPAVFSYYVEKSGFTNIRIAGKADFSYNLSFAVRKDLPQLVQILSKLLAAIPAERKQEIWRRWISLEITPFYRRGEFIITLAIIFTLITLITLWNITLELKVHKRTVELNSYKEHLEALVRERTDELSRRNNDLKISLEKVKLLSGFLPICASCKKIRDDDGYWQEVELYIRNHSQAEFSHSICPDCAGKLYGELGKDDADDT